jgi:hypothetical protein
MAKCGLVAGVWTCFKTNWSGRIEIEYDRVMVKKYF